ncbi:MAG: hypothetical protein ACI909_004356, partial [Planctomycetota bacterium]
LEVTVDYQSADGEVLLLPQISDDLEFGTNFLVSFHAGKVLMTSEVTYWDAIELPIGITSSIYGFNSGTWFANGTYLFGLESRWPKLKKGYVLEQKEIRVEFDMRAQLPIISLPLVVIQSILSQVHIHGLEPQKTVGTVLHLTGLSGLSMDRTRTSCLFDNNFSGTLYDVDFTNLQDGIAIATHSDLDGKSSVGWLEINKKDVGSNEVSVAMNAAKIVDGYIEEYGKDSAGISMIGCNIIGWPIMRAPHFVTGVHDDGTFSFPIVPEGEILQFTDMRSDITEQVVYTH